MGKQDKKQGHEMHVHFVRTHTKSKYDKKLENLEKGSLYRR
jgi:hypothetical protein